MGRNGVAVFVKLRGGSTIFSAFFILALLDGVGEVNGKRFLGEQIEEIIGTLLRIRFEGIVDARAGKQARVDDGGVCVVVSTVIIKPHARGRVRDADGGFAVDGHVVSSVTQGRAVVASSLVDEPAPSLASSVWRAVISERRAGSSASCVVRSSVISLSTCVVVVLI